MRPSLVACVSILAAGALMVMPSASAAPLSLNLIPTADVLGHGELALEYENDAEPLLSSEGDQYLLVQVGLFGRMEVGVDRCFYGAKATYGNLKFLVQAEGADEPAIALGVQNIVKHDDSQPYVTLAKHVNRTRLHLGAIQLYDETQAMAGIEFSLDDRVTLAVDCMAGDNGAAGLGGWIAITDNWYLSVARIISPTDDWDDYWQVVVSYYGTAF